MAVQFIDHMGFSGQILVIQKTHQWYVFVRFAKPGKMKKGMAQWKKEQEDLKSEKAKRWVYLCGRTGFKINDIKAHTYICSLHFVGGNGPTAEHPDPINALVKPLLLTRKRMIHCHMKWISNTQ